MADKTPVQDWPPSQRLATAGLGAGLNTLRIGRRSGNARRASLAEQASECLTTKSSQEPNVVQGSRAEGPADKLTPPLPSSSLY